MIEKKEGFFVKKIKKGTIRMKNKILLYGSLLTTICISCTGCSGLNAMISKPEPTVLIQETVTPEPTVEPIVIKKGDIVQSDMLEMKLKKVSFTDDVVPEYKIGTYAHYPAGDGRIYLEVKTKIKNLLEEDLACEDIATVTLITAAGESYMAFVVPETEAKGISDDPASLIKNGKTLGVRYIIDCPAELENSTEELKIRFQFSDKEIYEYIIQ